MGSQVRQLLPFVMLWFALLALFYVPELFGNRIDEQSLLDWCSDYCGAGSNLEQLVFLLIFYMLAAYSLFPREFDEGTIDFLRGLPLGRGQIFFSKVLATWLVICTLLLVDHIISFSLLSLNTQTITGKSYPDVTLTLLLRESLFAFVVVAHGVFISWFRVTGLVLYAAYLSGLYWLEQSLGMSGTYSIFRFFSNEYDGQQLLVDWPAIVTQLAGAVILLAIAWRLWSQTESRPKAKRSGKLSKHAATAMTVLAVLLLSIAMAAFLGNESRKSTSNQIVRLATDHYHFAYARSDNTRMNVLKQYADQDYQALVKLIGAEKQPFVYARMTLQSNHALGYASHTEIRMKLTRGEPVNPMYRRVLSHETTHVFQNVESSRALTRHRNSVGFFLEGMAQYTSFEVVPDDARRTTNWVISSMAWQRQNITFSQLANRTVFDSTYDPELLYGIGDIWVDAMVRHCGDTSLGDFLRSAGRDDAPTILSGSAYWRHHLRAIGCELEQVNHSWRQQMQTIVDDRREGAFPVFSNISTTAHNGQLLVSTSVTASQSDALPERYLIRLASETKIATKPAQILQGTTTQSDDSIQVKFSIPLSSITGSKFRYQIGYIPFPDSRHYFEKWRSGAVSTH